MRCELSFVLSRRSFQFATVQSQIYWGLLKNWKLETGSRQDKTVFLSPIMFTPPTRTRQDSLVLSVSTVWTRHKRDVGIPKKRLSWVGNQIDSAVKDLVDLKNYCWKSMGTCLSTPRWRCRSIMLLLSKTFQDHFKQHMSIMGVRAFDDCLRSFFCKLCVNCVRFTHTIYQVIYYVVGT